MVASIDIKTMSEEEEEDEDDDDDDDNGGDQCSGDWLQDVG